MIAVLFALLAGSLTPAPSRSAVETHESYARFYMRQAQLAARYNLPWEAYRLEHRAYLEAQAANAALKRRGVYPRSNAQNGFAAAGSYGWGSI